MTAILPKGAKDRIKTRIVVTFREGQKIVLQYKFWVTFKKLKRSEYKAMLQEIRNDLEENDIESNAERNAMVDNILDWEGVLDADNNPIEFEPDAVIAVLEINEYYQAISDAFLATQISDKARKAKNS